MQGFIARLGIRTKLVALFIAIKVIPMLLLALLAWQGVTRLGRAVSDRSSQMAGSMRDTVGELSTVMAKESVRALDLKSRELIERLTTDTALSVAEFLKARDNDVLLAASLDPTVADFEGFLKNRTRALMTPGKWVLSGDGKSWVQANLQAARSAQIEPDNPENKLDFNYRPPDLSSSREERPLYHEMTFVDLDGLERVKVSATGLLSRELRNVAEKRNTYACAETYFADLKRLQPGEIYVSDVIGPYVRSHYYGAVTPEAARQAKLPFAPEKEAYSGKENPVGKRFQGIIRWATPVVRNGKTIGYVTLALNHDHVMSFTDNLMPTEARYTPIPDASNGNYAFMWDYRDRNIAHPRHQSIIGFNPKTGDYETPWLEASIYQGWKQSGKPLRAYLATVPPFDHQSRDKKPSVELIKDGIRGLDGRYLNFAPQCNGWYDLTKQGGSGSFAILWSGVWKLTTAATIPYFTGKYGKTPRGFGYVTIGANVDEFHKAATATKALLDTRVNVFSDQMKQTAEETRSMIFSSMRKTAWSLLGMTALMIALVILIAVWLANMLTGRVTMLSSGLQKIEQGDLSFRLGKASDDEMGLLADSINRMADSVQTAFTHIEGARQRAEEANRMKSDFLASMSHELRTPLNGILGFSELLKFDLQDEEQRSYAETIHSSSEHLLNLLNDLLDMAKIEAGRMELKPVPTDLQALLVSVAAVHRAHAERKGLVLKEQYAPNLPAKLVCDPTRLVQILNNLLNNAVKFTAQGSITLSADLLERRIRFAVTDTGIGVPKDQQQQIFGKFHQADNFLTSEHTGTGLGLALAKEFSTLMGGEMGIESEPGQGACFFFLVPHP